LQLSLLQDVVKDSIVSIDNDKLQLTDVITAIKKLRPAARLCSEIVKLIHLHLMIPASSARWKKNLVNALPIYAIIKF